MRVIGVDGCRGGWIAVSYDSGLGTLVPLVHPSFQDVLDAYPDAFAIGVDIPIGLSDREPRACDLEARKVLMWKRSSVFPAPDPRLLDAATYEEANARSRALTGKGVSQQTFRIYPKVAEVNRLMTPSMQGRVFEVHPEVSFWALAGRPMVHPKDKPEGYEERRTLLAAELRHSLWARKDAFSLARPAQPDDLLDATVAAWTARRVAEKRAGRLPAHPALDGRKLRMEMVF